MLYPAQLGKPAEPPWRKGTFMPLHQRGSSLRNGFFGSVPAKFQAQVPGSHISQTGAAQPTIPPRWTGPPTQCTVTSPPTLTPPRTSPVSAEQCWPKHCSTNTEMPVGSPMSALHNVLDCALSQGLQVGLFYQLFRALRFGSLCVLNPTVGCPTSPSRCNQKVLPVASRDL